MKEKSFKRLLSAVLALCMVLALMPAMAMPASADEGVYVLDATADLAAFAAGEKADGDIQQAGTDGYFTIVYSAKTKVDGSNKTFDDGYTATQRLNFGGSSAFDPMKNAVKFVTNAPATVKIWWVSGGDGRTMTIWDNAGAEVAAVGADSVKNSLYIHEISLDTAGTYYLAVPQGSNYLFRLEVREEVSAPAQIEYVLDATTDLPAMAAGEKADGDTMTVADYFTIVFSAKTKIDGSNKTFDDGYTATQRLNFGGTSAFDPMKNAVKFTTSAPATVKLWWVCGGDGRTMTIWDKDGAEVAAVGADSVKNSLYIHEITLDAAGTYYLAVPQGSNYLFRLAVTEDHSAPVITEHTLDATADLPAMAAGEKADGDTMTVADYFTIVFSAKTKIDGSNKTFDDGYTATQRLNFGGSSAFDPMKNAVKFTTSAPAVVKIWWVSGGDGRTMTIWDNAGADVAAVGADSVKNSLYIHEISLETAGTYYLAVPQGSNYLFRMTVTETSGGAPEKPERASWETVAGPQITGIVQDGGDVTVSVTGLVGYDGADELVVTMSDASGAEIASKRSIAEKDSHNLVFTPADSGTYTFRAVMTRENEQPKQGEDQSFGFVLPLKAPVIGYAVNAGSGSVTLSWGAVKEAQSYDIFCDGVKVGNTEGTEYTVTGLTVGASCSFQVAAVRGEEVSILSAPVAVVITEQAQRIWGFTRYGSSTDDGHNGYVGSVNEDGKVTVYSEGGKGKIVPNSTDGVAFYYTPISASLNFTLRATVTVDSWTLSNGQEGFGLMAADRLGPNGDSASFWNNQYMAMGGKVEYNAEGGKYSLKLGLGSLAKTGLTLENLPTGAEMPDGFKSVTTTLDHTPEALGYGGGTYNIVGNATKEAPGTVAEQTTFILQIQKNNTGYFVSYYDAEGNLLSLVKDYDPDALSRLDAENVYVGFFAARNARITVSDIQLTTIAPEDDLPAEEKPVTWITPSVSIHSASITTDASYTVRFMANVAGLAEVFVDGVSVAKDIAMVGGVCQELDVTFEGISTHQIDVAFQPDPEQDLGPDTKLTSADPVTATRNVQWNADYAELEMLYVGPNGKPGAAATREDPIDIYTAVDNVHAGQTIVLMEGTYLLSRTVTIQRGIDGTEEAPISMIADQGARPVLDFQGICAGVVHVGNWWYFRGFDVTHSQNGQKGFQVSGDHNVLDQVNTYHNGNSGVQISRYDSTETTIAQWPSYNLILNCTSYGNADAGYEDADGFAAKLTCGEGNVFDGCVAYNNADDGWDLYAKVETGPIGAVTIRNCVAYGNGYLEDGTNAGNGNGFKMGGESITGKHKLVGSKAFFNKAKGIDSNSGPDIIVENSVSYNNESYNVAFYTNNANNTDFSATGIISFKDASIKSGLEIGENLKPKGTQDTAKYLGDTNYYWNGTASVNASGDVFTADRFLSLTFQGVSRKADGSIELKGFLELAASHVHVQPQFVWAEDHSCTAVIDCYCGYHEEGICTVTTETVEPTYTADGYVRYTAVYGEFADTVTVILPMLVNPFNDVAQEEFYFLPVMWAVDNGITNGIAEGIFAPNAACNRAQMVTFLWRAAGSPEPETAVNPFADVAEDTFYYKAVLWAVEKGITNGVDATHFAPELVCNRAQAVTFLWRAVGKPAAQNREHPFQDVQADGFYFEAMLWALEQGITTGTADTTFAPEGDCLRGQVVTFLYRTFGA